MIVGKYFLHNLDTTNKLLLDFLKRLKTWEDLTLKMENTFTQNLSEVMDNLDLFEIIKDIIYR